MPGDGVAGGALTLGQRTIGLRTGPLSDGGGGYPGAADRSSSLWGPPPPDARWSMVVAVLRRRFALLAIGGPPPTAEVAGVGQTVGVAGPLPGGFGDLVEAAVRGDAGAWNTLFDRFYVVVLRYAMARLGDHGAAEEVAQETFLRAVRGIRGLRARSEPEVEAWFVSIARNLVADRLRERARGGQLRGEIVTPTDAAEVAADRAAAAEIRQAMEALTEDQREVLLRRFVLDQSLEEVALALGRPVGAIKSLQHRALASLNRLLERAG